MLFYLFNQEKIMNESIKWRYSFFIYIEIKDSLIIIITFTIILQHSLTIKWHHTSKITTPQTVHLFTFESQQATIPKGKAIRTPLNVLSPSMTSDTLKVTDILFSKTIDYPNSPITGKAQQSSTSSENGFMRSSTYAVVRTTT